jgi:hypothetical protein
VKTSKLELNKDTMEEELEEFNVLQEELVTDKSHECRQGKFWSSDGHTYHMESDAAKQYVTFMFGEEEEEPVTTDGQACQESRQEGKTEVCSGGGARRVLDAARGATDKRAP